MSVSLNEVEATAKKAARGVGYPWGLAEEAGKAARWLCRIGNDGCGALADLLDQVDRAGISECTPHVSGESWTSRGELLCPIAAGAAVSDHAHDIAVLGADLEKVAHPILLAPFAAAIAQQRSSPTSLTADGAVLVTDGESVSISGEFPAKSARACIAIGGKIGLLNAISRRANPDADSWRRLNLYAERTYAPATEQSRLMGAGAGLSDND